MLKHFLYIGFFLLLLPRVATAQPVQVTNESPYNAVQIFQYYLQEEHFRPELAIRAFGPETPYKEERRMSIELQEILDGKGLVINPSLVPTDPDYKDSTKSNRYVLFPTKLPQVYLEKRNEKWYFSLRTLAAIADLHHEVYPTGSGWMLEHLPLLGGTNIIGIKLWQLLGSLAFILVAILLFLLFNLVVRYIVKLVAHSRFGGVVSGLEVIPKIARQLSWYIVFTLIILYLPVLQLPVAVTGYLRQGLEVARMIIGIVFVLRVVELVLFLIKRLTQKTQSNLDEQLVPIVGHIINTVIVVVGGLRVLYLLEVNVAALVAGISIGGLALALAAQDTVKNLLGSIMIFADKPFQIGDTIQSNDINGVVEEVGFRSTRIRTSDTSIISVPNGKISDLTINNMGVRTARRFRTEILVDNDTPIAAIEQFIERLRKLYTLHPNTNTDKTEVFINELKDGAHSIVCQTFLNVSTNADENHTRHELLIETLKTAEALNIALCKKD
ncbi:MAG: hypothetical protein RI894_767 [Bacteroidota bacterium]|jgi:MscS family membrane protein